MKVSKYYVALVNSVERNSKWKLAYCLSTTKTWNQDYRIFFCPFEINNEIYITYNEMSYRSVIQLKTEIVTQ